MYTSSSAFFDRGCQKEYSEDEGEVERCVGDGRGAGLDLRGEIHRPRDRVGAVELRRPSLGDSIRGRCYGQ
jgi:hypothetical protein